MTRKDELKDWRLAVKDALKYPERTIVCTRHAFFGEPDQLYDALILAGNAGVAVVFAPDYGHTAKEEFKKLAEEN